MKGGERPSKGERKRSALDIREIEIDGRLQPCPYFSGREARLPLRLPVQAVTPFEFDERLAEGDRRWGRFLYRPACPGCRACEALRVDVDRFRARRFQRRALKCGDDALTTEVGPPFADSERVALFEAHRHRRGLSHAKQATSLAEYRAFAVETCVVSLEFRYRLAGRLVGVGLADRGCGIL